MRPASFDQVGVDEEVVEPGFGEGLLDADAVKPAVLGGTVVRDGVGPEAGGTVAALRRPDAAGAAGRGVARGSRRRCGPGRGRFRRCRAAACSRGWRRR